LSIKDITKLLKDGEVASRERDIKIIEGWDLSDVDEYLKESKVSAGEDFLESAEAKVGDWAFAFPKPDFLSEAPAGADLEGYLFPDTYRIFRDASASHLIGKMLDNFSDKLTPKMIDDLVKSGRTIHEAVTMASIIEKEVSNDSDRKIVSGILHKRISEACGWK
jgi:UPF0755 protein